MTVLIPAYGEADKLRLCLQSIMRFSPANCQMFVLDDATPDDSIMAVCQSIIAGQDQIQYVRSTEHRGFVRTCNWGARQFRQYDSDLLLLSSNTEVTAGSLEEMQQVLHLHEKHGVVTPRSNNATFFSVPPVASSLPAQDSYELWLKIKDDFPRYTVMPSSAVFCMLIKGEVMERLGLFDELYSSVDNEENEFICRINRYGYSALAANHAFVFHHEGSASFGSNRTRLEEATRELFQYRYPEYQRKVSDYAEFHMDPVEIFSSLHLRHRPRILFDLFHLPAAYTGTSEFGFSLLREIAQAAEDEFDLYVGICQPEAFFDNDLAGYQIYEDRPDKPMAFDLLFKPCQVLSWYEFQRMNRLAPRLSYVLQDIIGIRCDYLSLPSRRALFQKTAELSDCVFTISEFSREDYAAYYGKYVPMRVIHHGTNECPGNGTASEGEYILIMGNHFVHKAVTDALERLGADYPIMVVGGNELPGCKPNVRWLRSGQISRLEMREAVAGARLLVYPSHYEGFGLPVIDALAMGKPVVTLESEINQELCALVNDLNLHSIHSLGDLNTAVSRLWSASQVRRSSSLRSWRSVALEYLASFRELLRRDVDVARLRNRWDFLRTITAAVDISA